jgi:hypothetical protein
MSSELIKKSKENNFQCDLYRDDIVIERKGSGLLNIISIANIFFLSSVILLSFSCAVTPGSIALSHANKFQGETPILLYQLDVSEPKPEGGVHLSFSYKNISDRPFSKVKFEFTPYDTSNKQIVDRKFHSKKSWNSDVLLQPGELSHTGFTSDHIRYAWYDPSVACLVVNSIEIYYQNGSNPIEKLTDLQIKKSLSPDLNSLCSK